jgi:copper resistance protein B
MQMPKKCLTMIMTVALIFTESTFAMDKSDMLSTADGSAHQESAQQHNSPPPPDIETLPLPDDMNLDNVLNYSAGPPPENFPDPVPDDRLYMFTFIEQLEYRISDDSTRDRLGWEAQGWIGGDYNKFWWKSEGESVFESNDEGDSETDLLYSWLITPFWNFQIGVQYANEWSSDGYDDRWSGVIALQGLAPYKFELDNSLYISEDGDVTYQLEAEYDVYITQRLILQPRTEVSVAAQDIPSRDMGAGITDINLDLRLRYEIKREFAPYIGIRYQSLVGETMDIADSMGNETEQLYFLAGLRLAF